MHYASIVENLIKIIHIRILSILILITKKKENKL